MIVSTTYWWSSGAPSNAKAKPSTKMTVKKRFPSGLAVAAALAAFLGGVAAHDGDGGVGVGGLRGPPRDQVGPPAAPGLALGGALPPGGGGAPPSPPGVELQDVSPQDGGALPPRDEAGPVVVRRLQVDPDDGWTLAARTALPGHNKLDVRGEAGDDSPVVDADQCKEMCQSLHWCKNIDMKTSDGYPRCLFSDLSADDVDAVGLVDSNKFDHYSLDRAQNDIAQAIAPPADLWTHHPGKALSGENKLDLRGEAGDDFPFMDVTQCKAMCMRLDWCVNFDMAASGRRCILSDVVVGEDGLADSGGDWDHYTLDRAPIGAELEAEREANAALRQRIESLEADLELALNRTQTGAELEAEREANAALRQRIESLEADRELEREANEEAAATQREEIRAQLSTMARQLLLTYTPSEYHRRLSQGDPATALLDDLVQDLCDSTVRYYPECMNGLYRTYGDALSLVPYCDVSAVTSFGFFFYCLDDSLGFRGSGHRYTWNPDISHWNVASGIDFRYMISMRAFRRDLSLWRIPYSSDRLLTDMFYHTGMDDIHHCPCIEQSDGTWRRECPGEDDLGWIECEVQEPADQADPITPVNGTSDGVQEPIAQFEHLTQEQAGLVVTVQDLIGELATCNTDAAAEEEVLHEQIDSLEADLEAKQEDNDNLRQLVADLEEEREANEEAAATQREEIRAQLSTMARQLLLTYTPSEYHRRLSQGDPATALLDDLVQDLCDSTVRYNPECNENEYHTYGDALSLVPYCDVSAVTSFRHAFICDANTIGLGNKHRWNPDISHWDVSSGTNFAWMLADLWAFRRDLSLWRIPYSRGRFVSGMFTGTAMNNIHHCPCIEDRDGLWVRWCPGKDNLGSLRGSIECEVQEPADQADPITPVNGTSDGVQEPIAQFEHLTQEQAGLVVTVQDLIGELATCNTDAAAEEQVLQERIDSAEADLEAKQEDNDNLRQLVVTNEEACDAEEQVLHERIDSAEATLEAERESNEEAVAMCSTERDDLAEEKAALTNDLVRQFLSTYPPSEYYRQLTFGSSLTAFVNTIVQELCGSDVRFGDHPDCVEANSHDLQQGSYWPEDTLSLIPYCDVSSVTSFQDFFQCGYGADFNPGDLSQWSIHCHADVDNPGVCTSNVTNMLQGTSVSQQSHCPCIEGAPGTWRRWCPGLGNLEGDGGPPNPTSWQHAVDLGNQYGFFDCRK